MDADYYYAGGRDLATGHGFTEMVLWNYLDNPTGLPHPSNAYWMPLASLLAAAGAALFGPNSWSAARVGFLAVAAALPPLTAALAWSFTARRDLAITSGLLAVFPAFYLPFLPVTDTFGLYMLLGGLFFLLLSRSLSSHDSQVLADFRLFSGHHLRPDAPVPCRRPALVSSGINRRSLFPQARPIPNLYSLFFGMCSFRLPANHGALVCPEYFRLRNAAGSRWHKMLWLTSYDQLFAFPASQLTLASWWHSGLTAILKARLWSLGLNLASTLSVQAEVFLLPLIGLGLWHLRKDRRVQLAALAWLLTLGAMTVVFPFAGRTWRILPFRSSPANSLVGAGAGGIGETGAVGRADTWLECGPGREQFFRHGVG